jgi:hypothetical protein
MYTKLDDARQAKFINNFMQSNPNCTMKDIIQRCVTNRTRLKQLEMQGYFKLPNPIPYGKRNGLFRKNA